MSLKPVYFGKYILLDKLAMGGMAEVYRAKAPGAEGIGKIVAIKRILPQFTANHEFIEMFKSEAKITVSLTQANIAQIYEFGEETEQFYIVMEFIDGKNLRQLLSRCAKMQKALTIEQCVFIMAQVANGLDYAHRCVDKNTGNPLHIIHRDMSPQNIMCSFEGEVKIIDFGIAKAESKIENTRTGILKGKFGYMSPEQAEGLELDARTDIFSTGIVLWELLSGERLFVASNEVNTIRKIRECQIPPLRKINPNIPEELERISMKALAKDRSLRYQTASELNRDLSRFLYKVNPEFTPHDLCIFAKSLFKDDIVEDRKKMLEFAKVSFPSKETGTHGTDIGRSITESSEFGVGDPDVPKNLHLNGRSADELAIDFNVNVRKINVGNTQSQQSHLTSAPVSHDNESMFSGTNVRPLRMAAHHTSSIHAGQKFLHAVSRYPWPNKMPLISIIVGAVFAAYLVWNNPRIQTTASHFFGTNSVTSWLFAHEENLPSETADGGGANTVAKARVFVRSLPAGASIKVDGEVLGTTPAEVLIPMRRTVTVELIRDGYLPYKRPFITDQVLDDIQAKLKEAHYGYLNIDTVPSGSIITLNGREQDGRSPFTKVPVPAEQDIEIRALNPLTNAIAITKVKVKENTVRDVTLYPIVDQRRNVAGHPQ